jgi:hypothetical protein
MSEHKTGQSNWTAEDKRLYRKRRESGLRGQLEITLLQKTGSTLSRGKQSGRRATLRKQWMAYNRQMRKASARGE